MDGSIGKHLGCTRQAASRVARRRSWEAGGRRQWGYGNAGENREIQVMIFQSVSPPASIASYVSTIVVIGNDQPGLEIVLPLIANGYPGIAFQVTCRGLTTHRGNGMEELFLYGQFVQPVELYMTGHFTFIAYFFFPHVLKMLFGFDSVAWPVRTVALSLFLS